METFTDAEIDRRADVLIRFYQTQKQSLIKAKKAKDPVLLTLDYNVEMRTICDHIDAIKIQTAECKKFNRENKKYRERSATAK